MPIAISKALDAARNDCANFENGALDIAANAVERIDLTGNDSADWVLDTSRLSCSSAASLFCGTGGCIVYFNADGQMLDRLAKGWTVVDFPPLKVILLQIHGSECGGINRRRCMEAIVFDEDGFQTLHSASN